MAHTVLRNLGGYWGDVIATKLKSQLSTQYYHHLLQLPQSYYDRELTGTIVHRLHRAISELGNFVNLFVSTILPTLLGVVLTIGIMAYYSLQLALLVTLLYPITLWLTALASRRWQQLQRRKNHQTDRAHGRLAEVVSQIKAVKSYVHESLEYRHFAKRYRKTLVITRKQSRYWHSMDVLRGVVVAVVFFLLFAYVFVQTVERHYSISQMVLLIGLMNTIRQPLLNLSQVIDGFQKALSGSRAFMRAMRLHPAIIDQPQAIDLPSPRGRIEFDNVSFRYPTAKDHQVLRGVSFSVRPHQQVALVGQSGGGKTTIAQLLMRLYEPTSGRILIDGVDIATVKQASLRQSIATVFQEPVLFSGTIRQNIAYGKPMASDQEIQAAARAANADEFIGQLESGYQTQIGEHGLRLSGGQRQRLAIARAILKNAPILILDEATSNLDNKNEQLVQQALQRLMRGRTTFIIAHRLDTIAKVDTIITLKNGRVDEIGPPSHLAQTTGIYARLLQLQHATEDQRRDQLAAYDIGHTPKKC